jgi:hypothetical protein
MMKKSKAVIKGKFDKKIMLDSVED